MIGMRRIVRARRVDHATDEATRAAHRALAHLAGAAAEPVAQGRVGAAPRVVAGVAGTGVAVVGAAYAGCYGVMDRHAVVADVVGAGVVVVDGDTGGAAGAAHGGGGGGARLSPACPRPAEIKTLATG